MILAISILTVLLCGCTVTRVAHFGRLPDQQPLVTLVVTEDRNLIRRECQRGEQAPILGCEITGASELSGPRELRTVKIVRYTDHLPSELAMEIEAHELCHAVAALQGIPDPCHADNGGMLQSALPTHQFNMQ